MTIPETTYFISCDKNHNLCHLYCSKNILVLVANKIDTHIFLSKK